MKTKKIFKVIMLPVSRKNDNILWKLTKPEIDILPSGDISKLDILHFGNDGIKGAWKDGNIECQHLYIISDCEIKEDDWFIHDNRLFQCGFIAEYIDAKGNTGAKIADNSKQQAFEKDNCKKIVATTDKSILEAYSKDMSKEDFFPRLPESFIQDYIKAYNEGKPIIEIDLETEDVWAAGTSTYGHGDYDYKIKIKSDNTVIIH